MEPVKAGVGAAAGRRAIPPECTETRWKTPDGWGLRQVDWPVPEPCRGSLLYLPGRGDFLEKYLETLAYWNSRGWAVTALDWRGQALSGRLGADSMTGHVDDFARWVDDLAAFWPDWAAGRPGPHVLAAHSMGGHLALRTVAEGRVRPAALVLSAPMLGFAAKWLPAFLTGWTARLMCRLGDPRRPAWGAGEKPGQAPPDRMALLTHDAGRYADEAWWREHRPGLGMGPPSWGWLRAALASFRRLDRREVLSAVTVPVFIAATSADRLVSFAAIERAARWLPQVRLLRFGAEARHELLRESDPVRGQVIAAIDEWLDEVVPPAK